MKKLLFIVTLLIIVSCAERKNNTEEQVITYYNGFNNADYNQIKEVISDSLIITEGDHKMPFTSKSFYKQFKWDSVFKPTYKIIELKNQGEHSIATVAMTSVKFEFLKNNPFTCNYAFYFKSGKIRRIETLDCIDVNWEVWEKEKGTLVNWIKLHHPELDGFINDLSMKGAIDYIKAIELYKKHQDDL